MLNIKKIKIFMVIMKELGLDHIKGNRKKPY